MKVNILKKSFSAALCVILSVGTVTATTNNIFAANNASSKSQKIKIIKERNAKRASLFSEDIIDVDYLNPSKGVEFADLALETAIKQAMGKDIDSIITYGEAQKITDLNLASKNISTLKGIEAFSNLKTLNLDKNRLMDIYILGELTSLTSLSLYGNQIDNLYGLSSLAKLNTLNLSDNNFDSFELTELKNLNSLKTLNLSKNELDDISELSNLKLTSLDISKCIINDLSPLTRMTSLKTLYANDNEIDDISALSALKNLTELNLDNNMIGDLTPLLNLTSIQILHLNNTGCSDIEGINGLKTNLTELYLNNNSISDLSPLSGESGIFRKLKILHLSNNLIDGDTLENLSTLPVIEELYLNNNDIDSISHIANLPIKRLDLHSNKITSLAYVEEEEVTDEDGNTQVVLTMDKFLKNATKTNFLSLYDNQITELSYRSPYNDKYYSFLEDLFTIETLEIDAAALTDENQIKALTDLKNSNKFFTTLNVQGEIEDKYKTALTSNGLSLNFDKLDKIEFGDTKLAQAIESEIGINFQNIRIIDAEKVEILDLSNKSVNSVDGLRYFKNLKTLNLNLDTYSDLTEIIELPNLISGTIKINGSLDDETYKKLSDKGLIVNDIQNESVDFGTNADLEVEVLLYLRKDDDGEISLKDANEVTYLDLSGTGITDLSGIEQFSNLTGLNLSETSINDLSPLKSLKKLNYLNIYNTQVYDLKHIANIESLNYLNANYVTMSSLIDTEDIDFNPETDASDLSALKNLKFLHLDFCQLSDISALKNLPNLKYLYLNENSLTFYSNAEVLETLPLTIVDIRTNGFGESEKEKMIDLVKRLNTRGADVYSDYTDLNPDPNPDDSFILGDVDGDGYITASDASMVLMYVLMEGEYPLSTKQKAAAMVTKEQTITVENAEEILKKSLNADYRFKAQ